jgi:hypothetical protein
MYNIYIDILTYTWKVTVFLLSRFAVVPQTQQLTKLKTPEWTRKGKRYRNLNFNRANRDSWVVEDVVWRHIRPPTFNLRYTIPSLLFLCNLRFKLRSHLITKVIVDDRNRGLFRDVIFTPNFTLSVIVGSRLHYPTECFKSVVVKQ